jgi:iron complex outermembrane receptor protein
LIGGARYSREERTAWGTYALTPIGTSSLPRLGSPVTYDDVTPRASVRYRVTDDDDNVYFTYSQGFKSGGFNISALQPTPFKPEQLDSYEIGLKTDPSRSLSANISAFYYDYKDQQESAVVNGFNITTNAASARIYGADAEIVALLGSDWRLNAGVEYLHARFDSYDNAPGVAPIPGPDPDVPCNCGNQTVVLDLSDGPEPFSPDFTVSLGASYRKDLSVGTLDLSSTLYYSDTYYFQPQRMTRIMTPITSRAFSSAGSCRPITRTSARFT